MDTVWQVVLAGTFYGFKPDRVFELSDGSRWRQEDGIDVPSYSEWPPVKLLTKPVSGVIHMAVGEATAMMRVVPLDHGRKVREL